MNLSLPKKSLLTLALMASFMANLSGCMSAYKKSVGGDREQVMTKYYLSDFDTVWLSVLSALKSSPLDVANRESGYIRTKWIENTSEKNFYDSFGSGKFYLKAQYRFDISLSKGFYNGVPAVKVSAIKEQMIQRDVLEGWNPVASDLIDEKTLLYRIGRLVYIQKKIAQADDRRAESVIQSAPEFEEAEITSP